MTEQWYSDPFRPGQIADFLVDDALVKRQLPPYASHDLTNNVVAVISYAYENFKGPFSLHTPSTAHWAYHYKVSHENDMKVLEALQFERYTHVTNWNKKLNELPYMDAKEVNQAMHKLSESLGKDVYEANGKEILMQPSGIYLSLSYGILSPKGFTVEDEMLYKLKFGIRPLRITPMDFHEYFVERDARHKQNRENAMNVK